MAEETTNVSQNAQNDTQTTETDTAITNSQTEENVSENKSVDLEKLIQRAVDRATNKLGNENKKLRTQLETFKKEKLNDDEIKELELKDKEADLADRDAKLKEKENRFFAITAIKEAGLDDGSKNALDLVDFVMADDEESINTRVKTFSELVKRFVAAEVSQTFKSNGRNPDKGGNGENNATNNIAAVIGKTAADRTTTANKVLEHYLGGRH